MSAGEDRRDDGTFGPLHRGDWSRPSSRIRDRVRHMPGDEMLDAASPESAQSFRPDDVRAASDALAGGDEVVVTCSHEHADVTVSIRPPSPEGLWLVSGRAWLIDGPQGDISLALVHDDHVLGTKRAADGEYFELEEVLPSGWHLEVHLPGGACLRVDDPRS